MSALFLAGASPLSTCASGALYGHNAGMLSTSLVQFSSVYTDTAAPITRMVATSR